MNHSLFARIWDAQGRLAADPQYAGLLEEYRLRNAALLKQLDTMSVPQREAVMDYLGVLTELNSKMLTYLLESII